MIYNTNHNTNHRQSNRAGAMMPLMAVTMVFLFVAAVFAVDLSRMHNVRSELRTATDAAARAAVESLSRNNSESDAIQAALDIAQLNLVAGQPLELDPSKIVFGASLQNEDGSFSFVDKSELDPSSRTTIVNSVQVLGERTSESSDGHVNLIFGGLLGVDNFEPVQSATAARLDRDIALVLDRSGSMLNEGRFEALINGVNVFVQELNETQPKERVSLIVYDSVPETLLGLTKNIESILEALAEVEPDGKTAIGLGMRNGLDSLINAPNANQFALKSMIVMTDGRQNVGVSPMVVAEECRVANVVVHTITFSDGADQDLMQAVADHTGGTHLHATSDADLLQVFRQIARQLAVILIE